MASASSRRIARRVIVTAALCVTMFVAIVVTTPGAGAQQVPNTPQVEAPRSIPLPNTGEAPKAATDRGGWVQEAIFFGICGAILLMVGLVVLESRRKLRARAEAEAALGAAQTRTSTRNDPVAETSSNAPDSSARQ